MTPSARDGARAAEATGASLPMPLAASAARALSAFRAVAGLRASVAAGRLWLKWDAGEPGSADIAAAALAVPGAELFVPAEDGRRRLGRRLPAFDFPGDSAGWRSLARVVVPGAIRPVAPEPGTSGTPPMPARLVRDPAAEPRPASALACPLPDLADWASSVPPGRVETLRGALLGGRCLVIGRRPPELFPVDGEAAVVRMWGAGLLIPLGLVPEPRLDEPALRRALGLSEGEIGVWTPEGVEAVPAGAVAPLTRAKVLHAAGRGPAADAAGRGGGEDGDKGGTPAWTPSDAT
jgi:hypothetical protein